MKDYKILRTFPSPVFHYKVENHKELNKELENYILNLKKNDPKGQQKSNVSGGWHSQNFDFINDSTAKKFLSIAEKFSKKTINEIGWNYDSNRVIVNAMWSIINKKGSFNIMHNHPNAYLSSAYYVKHPEKSGDIKFFDPRDQKAIRFPKIKKHGEFSAGEVQISPNEGDLLIFPAYLYHSVNQNLSGEDRIIISFNVDIKYK